MITAKQDRTWPRPTPGRFSLGERVVRGISHRFAVHNVDADDEVATRREHA
jgi:hypothetical protein